MFNNTLRTFYNQKISSITGSLTHCKLAITEAYLLLFKHFIMHLIYTSVNRGSQSVTFSGKLYSCSTVLMEYARTCSISSRVIIPLIMILRVTMLFSMLNPNRTTIKFDHRLKPAVKIKDLSSI